MKVGYNLLQCLQATDDDINATFSTIFYEIIAVDPPYLVDRETGEVTTADVFTGRSGEVDQFTVVAYDNMGNAPTFTATAILTVSHEKIIHGCIYNDGLSPRLAQSSLVIPRNSM